MNCSHRLLLTALGALLVGCQASDSRPPLNYALFTYNQGVRWGRPGDAAAHVPAGSRAAFLERSEGLTDLKITESRVVRVKVKNEDTAIARVKIEWYELDTLTVHRTTMEQRWEFKNKRWWVTRHRRVAGPPMPLYKPIRTSVDRRAEIGPTAAGL